MESQMGEAFNQLAANPDYMKQFRRGVLDRLIDQALIDDKARSWVCASAMSRSSRPSSPCPSLPRTASSAMTATCSSFAVPA